MENKQFANLDSAQSVKIIAFDELEVRPGFVSGTYILIVRGEAPCANMDVRLSPRIYIDCPEYWGIEVTGSLPGGICLTAIKPFSIAMELNGVIGSRGVEVIGSNKTEKHEVGGGCRP